MNQETPTKLLEHLAQKFAASPEDWATEALCHVLNSSEAASSAFIDFFNQADVELPEQLTFETQSIQDDQSRPDLIGRYRNDRLPLIVESKFWAGLTSNQPGTYLEHLPAEEDAVIAVIAPSRRMSTLWDELLFRCNRDEHNIEEIKQLSESFKYASVDESKVLLLTSWKAVISSIDIRVSSEGELSVVDDIQQLSALCNKMDTEAFLPLAPEELTRAGPRRLRQFQKLIHRLVDRLTSRGVASTEGLQWTSTGKYHRQYIRLSGHGGFIAVDYRAWRDLRETPLWLGLKGKDFGDDLTNTKEKLRPLLHTEPPEVLDPDWADYLRIPLVPPTRVEQEQVLRSLTDRIIEIARLLEESAD